MIFVRFFVATIKLCDEKRAAMKNAEVHESSQQFVLEKMSATIDKHECDAFAALYRSHAVR